MTVLAHAKVNFTLEVFGVRPDGYHALRSVVVPISLADEIDLEDADGVSLAVDGSVADVEVRRLDPEKNLAVKAVRLLQRVGGVKRGVAISLHKHVPAQSGLGGGSADAAAVLKALAAHWRLGCSLADLAALGAELGSDVPALVAGGCVLMEGRGEIVTPFPAPPPLDLALVFPPGVRCSTAEIYSACSSRLTNTLQIVNTMRSAFLAGDKRAIADGLQNDLFAAAAAAHPEIAQAAARLAKTGCRGVSMTGSGSALFALAPSSAQVPGCVMVSTAAFDAA